MWITWCSMIVGVVPAPFLARSGRPPRRTGPRALSSSSCRFRRAAPWTRSRGWCRPGCNSASAPPSSSKTSPADRAAPARRQAANSPPDGNNWLFVFDTHAVNPFLQNLPFDTEKDLDPVVLIGTAPNVLATHPSRPYKTLPT